MVYPNPSISEFNVKTEYKGKMDINFISLDTEYKKLITSISSEEKVNIENIPKGNYWIIITIEGDTVYKTRWVKNE
ncbi:hypothetical protein A33Q_2893 [Indibacter alkaliphilus LW1]|uniref:Secretion system C-terminal sorting domain-containing protein n=2 Tax=Indibacter TaxID=647744 RepID=S2DTX8_INDAL|nr:hypothetical protein A33Q_2893 [Indibacter alkaliphilus LW1]